LIALQTILTAGHCTDFWSTIRADDGLESIMVSFDPQASVGEDWMPDRGTWYAASTWLTHPDYVEAEWPFTFDYGLLYLDEPVEIEPADLPAPNVLQPIIDGKGQTAQRFEDVGYGIQGTIVGNGPPRRAITWERKNRGSAVHPRTRIYDRTVRSALVHPQQRALTATRRRLRRRLRLADLVCGYGHDRRSPHGGYRLGYHGVLCGRLTSLNHRIDVLDVLN
jgi:hypothetical protein